MVKIEFNGLHGDETQCVQLNGEAEKLFLQFFSPDDINYAKTTLFNLMHGIAETSIAFNKLTLKDEPDAFVSTNINTGLYLIARFYELLDGFEEATRLPEGQADCNVD